MVGFAGGGRAQVEMEECTLVRPPGLRVGMESGRVSKQNYINSTPFGRRGVDIVSLSPQRAGGSRSVYSGLHYGCVLPFVSVRQRPLSAVSRRIFSFRASAAMSCSSVRCMR